MIPGQVEMQSYWPGVLISQSFKGNINSNRATRSDRFRSFWRLFQEEGAACLQAFLPNSVGTVGTIMCKPF